uniref:hypothetical protein n=1 Tax=Flavobacterium sp. TaxID=239 RepID=UPI00404994DC
MFKIKILSIIVSILAFQRLYSQDSIVFYQNNSKMFSNRYVFFKNGTFKHYYQTDDGQYWFGVGTYKDKGRKRILKFEDADLNYKKDFGLIHYEANFQRILLKRRKEYKSIDYYYTSRKKYVRFKERKPNG